MTDESGARVTGLVVRVAGTRWFIPVAEVVEVLREPVVARLPSAGAAVVGVVNHRGRVMAVADPVRALGLSGQGGGNRDIIVVDTENHRFAVAVDAVIELVPEPRTGLATLDLVAVARAVFG